MTMGDYYTDNQSKVQAYRSVTGELDINAVAQVSDVEALITECSGLQFEVINEGFSVTGDFDMVTEFQHSITNIASEDLTVTGHKLPPDVHECIVGCLTWREKQGEKGALVNKTYDLVAFCLALWKGWSVLKDHMRQISLFRKDGNAPKLKISFRNKDKLVLDKLCTEIIKYHKEQEDMHFTHEVMGGGPCYLHALVDSIQNKFKPTLIVLDTNDLYISTDNGNLKRCKEFIKQYQSEDEFMISRISKVESILAKYCKKRISPETIKPSTKSNSTQTSGDSQPFGNHTNDTKDNKDKTKPPLVQDLQLDPETVTYIKMFHMDALKKLEAENDVMIDCQDAQREGKIQIIASTASIPQQVIDNIGRMLQEIYDNIINDVIDLTDGDTLRDKIDNIKPEANQAKVWVSTTLRPGKISLIGPADGVKTITTKIKRLLGMADPPRERIMVSTSVSTPEGGARAANEDHRSHLHASSNCKASKKNILPQLYVHSVSGIRVHTEVTDITQMSVDAVVNAANEDLKHFGGVASAISKAAGSDFQQESDTYIRKNGKLGIAETCVTSAGKMPCQKVIHVVGPIMREYENADDMVKLLHQAFTNVLVCANKYQLKSVAIPAISSGIYGVPQYLVADIACSAVNEYLSTHHNKTSLTDIHLVDIGAEIVQLFQKQMKGLVETQEFAFQFDAEAKGATAKPNVKDTDKQHSPTNSHTPPSSNNKPDHMSTQKGDDKGEEEDCCICMCPPTNPKTLKCKHTFCTECIDRGFKVKPACPICGMIFGVITGSQPEGRMNVRKDRSRQLPGYDDCGLIEINYAFPSGTQGKDHPHPGQGYSGTNRTAYLPDNAEGNKVLQLLRRAFDARLVFTIGHSRTTGAENTVTWNDIHHKTSTHGGPQSFGYPDPTYLNRVQEELAAKGVK